ncbi:MAG: YbaN family protein [Gammaproteobacteria bacterium]|nr:YbaN family protein [Gammaproteobacteria bacterium]
MSRLIRWPSLVLAYLFLGLAIVGIPLPGLPTVPFLLLAAWFAARGSVRLHRWLYAHPQFGAVLIDWEQQGAVSRRSKVIAVGMLIASWLVMFWQVDKPWLLTGVALLFVAVATFLLTRPEPR